MSKRSDLLVACMLGNRWNATHAPAAGATVVLSSPSLGNPLARTHLESIWYSIRNQMGAGALNTTVTLSIRQASAAGTVIASIDHLVQPSQSANVAISNMALFAKRGNAIAFTMDTVIGSVKATVNAAGWVEDTNG